MYEYDFGDSWNHEILGEKILPTEAGTKYPLCLKGKWACPPEDVGGIGGYYRFLQPIADPKNPEHEDMLEWGGPFEPDVFDKDAINEYFRMARRRRKPA